MSETTLRVRITSQLQGLTEYSRALREAKRDLEGLTRAQRENASVGAANLPTEAGVPTRARGMSVAGPDTDAFGVPTQPMTSWHGQDSPPKGGGPSGGAPTEVPPSPPAGRGPPAGGGPSGGPPAQGGGTRAAINRGAVAGYSYMRQAATTAAVMGLGQGITGFFLTSGQKYMELSRVITHLGRRFREAADDVHSFGGTMGFTIAQTSQFVETLGTQTNRVTRPQVQRYLGFARDRGVDPGEAMSRLGTMERVMGGRQLSDVQLAMLSGRATQMGMGQGRMEEFLGVTTQLAESMFQQTGTANFGQTLGLQTLPGQVFGMNDPRAQGQAGNQFLQGLHATMTGGGPMKSYMMRAMGYGKPGGPGYIEMKKRLEAGIYDSENITDLFSSFQERGMGRGAQFRALESVAGGQLKAYQIEALVSTLGTEKGLEQFKANMAGGGESAMREFYAGLTFKDEATFKGGGFADLGRARGRIGLGESAGVQLEGMQMAVGAPVARGMLDMRESIANIGSMLQNIMGVDFAGLFTGLTGAVKSATELIERVSEEPRWKGSVNRGAERVGRGAKYMWANGYVDDAMQGMKYLPGGGAISTVEQAYELGTQAYTLRTAGSGGAGGGAP